MNQKESKFEEKSKIESEQFHPYYMKAPSLLHIPAFSHYNTVQSRIQHSLPRHDDTFTGMNPEDYSKFEMDFIFGGDSVVSNEDHKIKEESFEKLTSVSSWDPPYIKEEWGPVKGRQKRYQMHPAMYAHHGQFNQGSFQNGEDVPKKKIKTRTEAFYDLVMGDTWRRIMKKLKTHNMKKSGIKQLLQRWQEKVEASGIVGMIRMPQHVHRAPPSQQPQVPIQSMPMQLQGMHIPFPLQFYSPTNDSMPFPPSSSLWFKNQEIVKNQNLSSLKDQDEIIKQEVPTLNFQSRRLNQNDGNGEDDEDEDEESSEDPDAIFFKDRIPLPITPAKVEDEKQEKKRLKEVAKLRTEEGKKRDLDEFSNKSSPVRPLEDSNSIALNKNDHLGLSATSSKPISHISIRSNFPSKPTSMFHMPLKRRHSPTSSCSFSHRTDLSLLDTFNTPRPRLIIRRSNRPLGDDEEDIDSVSLSDEDISTADAMYGQYTQVTRTKNRYRCELKDVIICVGGREYAVKTMVLDVIQNI
jgi:hypothetical protein